MADGQRVRWWQEDQGQAKSASKAVGRTSSTPALLVPETAAPHTATVEDSTLEKDTWAELEAEALRRSQGKTEEVESVSYYLNKPEALVQHQKASRILGILGIFIFLLSAALQLLIDRTATTHLYPVIWGVSWWPLIVVFQIQRGQWLRNLKEPLVYLTSQGIRINTFNHANLFLNWSDIKSITPKHNNHTHFLVIKCEKKQRYIIPTKDLAVSAEALASRIADYRAARAMD